MNPSVAQQRDSVHSWYRSAHAGGGGGEGDVGSTGGAGGVGGLSAHSSGHVHISSLTQSVPGGGSGLHMAYLRPVRR